jgi:NAD(P)-dependent dehydrogenase (short-subunit alcohol dehydrogenase family)
MSRLRWGTWGAIGYLGWRLLSRREEDLVGEVVLITGGSRGLGLLLAHEFARRGCRLALCARDEDELERARVELEGRGAEVLVRRCDVSQRDEVDALVAAVHERFGRIDVLVNNASIVQVGPLESMTLEDFQQAMAVNFWGGVHATLAVLPEMRARRRGRIVNITSIGGKVAFPHLLPYDAAKFALLGFSKGLRAELARHGVSVTTIVPGFMRTGSPLHALFKGDQDKEFTWFVAGDSLPLTSMDALRAARRIVQAAARREGEVTLGWQARTLRLVHALAPGTIMSILGLANRALPTGRGRRLARGLALGAPGPLRRLLERQGSRTNQLG